jgi:hypothetical protein
MRKRGLGVGPVRTGKGGAPLIVQGVIQSVDTETYTCTVATADNRVWEGVPINPQTVGKDGRGSFYMPEVDSPVWVCRPSDQRMPFIMAGSSLPKQMTDEDDEDPNDHRMARPVLGEGDHMLSGAGSSPFVILRKGGSLEIGSTQMAQRIYVPLQDTIREFFGNLEQHAAGGSMEWKTRTDDDTHGTAKDPVEYRLRVKEFSDEEPMIDIGFGRIKGEDLQSTVDGLVGEIVGRVLINNTTKLWIDKSGNLMRVQDGGEFVSLGGKKTEYIHADFFQQVRGISSVDYGSREVVVQRNDTQSVGGDQSTSVGGSLVEKVSGPVTRTTGRVTEEIKGAHLKTVQGDLDQTIIGNLQTAVGGDVSQSSGGSSQEVVAGRKTITVTNSGFLSGEDVGFDLVVKAGDTHMHSVIGDLKITVGTTKAAALAEIILKPTGLILLKSVMGQLAEVQINSTGVRMKTPAGEISIDPLGTVALGPPGRGAVVTTLTHPVDYVTGAPILGSSSVAAGGIPSPIALPSIFIDQDL